MWHLLKLMLFIIVVLVSCPGFKQIGHTKMLVFDELGRLLDPEDAFYSKNSHIPDIKKMSIPEVDAYDYFGSTKLYEAVAKNNINEVQQLLKAGANPNVVTAHDKTALELAVHNDYLNIAELLLENGAIIDLNWPIRNVKSEIMRKLLLRYGASTEPPLENPANQILLMYPGEASSLESTIEEVNASGDKSTISTVTRAVIFNYSLEQMQGVLDRGKNINEEDEEFGTPLFQAIRQRRGEDILKFLLDNGADPNLMSRGQLPLIMAIEKENLEAVRLVLQFGADPNLVYNGMDGKRGTPAIIEASRQKNLELLDLIIQAGASVNIKDEDGRTALYYAVNSYNFCEPVAKLLLENGASQQVADGRFVLEVIDNSSKNIGLVIFLLDRGASLPRGEDVSSYLSWAVREDNWDLYRAALKAGVSMVKWNKHAEHSPLETAVREGKVDFVTALLKDGAPINGSTGSVGEVFIDARGKRYKGQDDLLAIAVEQGNIDVVRLLLEAKVLLNNHSNNYAQFYPLHIAVNNKRADMVKILLDAGSKPNVKDRYGDTPLHMAVNTGQNDIVEILVCGGANPNVMNEDKETALDMASNRRLTEIVEILSKNGIK